MFSFKQYNVEASEIFHFLCDILDIAEDYPEYEGEVNEIPACSRIYN